MNIKVNETPIRTSRNFGINNIKLTDIKIPKNSKIFKSIEITNVKESSNDVISKKLTYGNGEILEKNVSENANHKVKIETKNSKDLIKIIYDFDDENTELINEIEIIGNKDANVIIEYKSNTDKKCFHNGIIRTIVNEGCKLNVAIVNMLNSESNNFEAMENELFKDSKLKYTIIDLGGKTSVTNYYSNILGENSNNDLKTIYLGKENEIKDLNYIAEVRGEKANIDIDVQGALGENCKKNFKGTIDFKKGCKKAKGDENEFCLLLSDTARSIALPMLLCTEDDVEGNHSTASGKVDSKSLFYIMSRGLSYKEAVKLIVKSNFNKIIERIKDEEIKEEILKEIDRRLN